MPADIDIALVIMFKKIGLSPVQGNLRGLIFGWTQQCHSNCRTLRLSIFCMCKIASIHVH